MNAIYDFWDFDGKTAAGGKMDPKGVSPAVWAARDWEKLGRKKTEEKLLPFLKFQVERAVKTMPEIYGAYRERKISVSEFRDLNELPALVKDTAHHTVGFREKIKKNPYALLPNDLKNPFSIYKSGGTRGVATPTFITDWDGEVESNGLKKCFEYMQLTSKDIILNSYNPTHKGGHCITEAALKLGAKVVPRRTSDSAREVIQTIDQYGVTVLAAVQGPLSENDETKKGGGTDFISLVEAGQDVLEEKIKTLFITGYTLIPEVIAWAEAHGKKLATTLGSSEAIPQATSTIPGRLCKYNNLHLINGPHYVEIVKQESGQLIPVKKGETGILVYTTIAREGTIYLRYAPGDSAKLVHNAGECDCGIKTPIISEIRRIDIPEDTIAAGCCIG
jgi:phenylacetate-coenzyme A ligase PaaK-like adenylate-forming protein